MKQSVLNFLSDKQRQIMYVAYSLIGIALGATQVGFTSAELAQPQWLTVALAVYVYLGVAFGFVAAGNTNKKADQS